MDSKEAQEPPRVPAVIIKSQQCQVFVLVILIQCSFIGRICEVCRWRSVKVGIKHRGVSETQLACFEAVMGPLDGAYCAGDNGCGGLIYVAE